MEAVLLLLVGAAPWLFGSVHPLAELLLFGGLGLLALLWIARIVAERCAVWNLCSITLVLAMMCALTMAQIVPVPRNWLAVISPGTDKLRSELLPEKPEEFPSAAEQPQLPTTATVSLAPWATRHVLVQMIAALFVFSLVRSNFSSPETIYRLAIVAVFNGVALSAIGLAQWVSSKPNMVFWTFASEGQVFGPFICRNHFAYYINMSMGLGIGLLLRSQYFQTDAPGSRKPLSALSNMLQDPWLMWIGSALVVMAAGLCCSLSRGGLAAFVIAAVVCLAMQWRHAGRLAHWSSGVVFVLFGLAVTAWLGAGTVGRRLATVWETNIIVEEGRGSVWSRALKLFHNADGEPTFPWFGTGMGTFRFVEPLTRGPADLNNLIHEHMHNDFLEVLLEGGIFQLALVLTLAFLIFRIGFQALQRHQATGTGAMVTGALFGLVSVAIHSTVDFGLHVPAVTLLAVTIAGCLSNLGEPASAVADAVPSRSLAWLPAVTQAAVLVVIGVFVLDYAWRSERVERYRLAANATTPDQMDKKIAYLEAAVAYTPNDPLLQAAAGDAYRERQHRCHKQCELILIMAGANLNCPWLANSAASLIPPVTGDTVKSFEHYFQARNQCPLIVQPNLFMAAYDYQCRRADPAEVYLGRACKLDPSNSGSWYVAGRMALKQGRWDNAWKYWRRSLECDRSHLDDIVAKAAPFLSAELLIDRVLPPDPEVVYQALLYLETTTDLGTDEKLYLNRAIELLAVRPLNLSQQLILKARIEDRLDRKEAAIDSYRRALEIEPRQGEWRLELCKLLRNTGKLDEAQRELGVLESLSGLHSEARDLREAIATQKARGGSGDR